MAAGKETMRIPASISAVLVKGRLASEELSANAGCASFKIKIIPGDRRDLSPAERRKGLKNQERLEELGQS
jgi:hypothetical protein